MPHRPQTICHSDRNRIIRSLNDSEGHVGERPFMPPLSVLEGAAFRGQDDSSGLQLDADSHLGKPQRVGPPEQRRPRTRKDGANPPTHFPGRSLHNKRDYFFGGFSPRGRPSSWLPSTLPDCLPTMVAAV